MHLPMFMNNQMVTEKAEFTSKTQIANYIIEEIKHNFDDLAEEEKEKLNSNIERKLKAGKKLSQKEVEYLRQNNPQMYMQYVRIRARAEAMAEQLKHAKSKQQANNIIMLSRSSVSDKDPCKEYIIAAMNKIAKEYKSSPQYARLPNTDEELAKKKNSVTNSDFEQNEEDFDLMSWSPLQEVIDAMPKFNVSA